MNIPIKIHIFGASGSGTTTLARALSEEFRIPHFDADDFFWKPSDPPFQKEVDALERNQNLRSTLDESESWILSGCVSRWGEWAMPNLSLSVFTYLDADIRIQRLQTREESEFGPRIKEGGDMHKRHLFFMAWAASYDEAKLPIRSRVLHEHWMKKLPHLLIKLDTSNQLSHLVSKVKQVVIEHVN